MMWFFFLELRAKMKDGFLLRGCGKKTNKQTNKKEAVASVHQQNLSIIC